MKLFTNDLESKILNLEDQLRGEKMWKQEILNCFTFKDLNDKIAKIKADHDAAAKAHPQWIHPYPYVGQLLLTERNRRVAERAASLGLEKAEADLMGVAE